MCVIMRFPRCDVCKSWKMPWKMILLKEWEPCVRVYDSSFSLLYQSRNSSVLISRTNQKQFPVVESSFQHKCYYLNTSSPATGWVLVLMAPIPAVCLTQNFLDHWFSPSLQPSSSSNRKNFTSKGFRPGRRGQRKVRKGGWVCACLCPCACVRVLVLQVMNDDEN